MAHTEQLDRPPDQMGGHIRIPAHFGHKFRTFLAAGVLASALLLPAQMVHGQNVGGSQNPGAPLSQPNAYGWVVACFLDNGEQGEKLNLFYSADGKTISGGNTTPVYSDDRLRDPSIIYWADRFFVAYTLNDGRDRNFRIISSPDGSADSWSTVATVDVSPLVAPGDKAWAPELVVDGSDVYVFFTWQKATTSETAPGAGDGPEASMGWLRATGASLADWTAPTALSTSGFSETYIDGVPVKYGDTWYFFSSAGSQIYRARSTTGITGVYTQDRSGDWAGWGTGIEGPYVIRIGDIYRIYYDRYLQNSGHWYSESTDLANWSDPQQLQAGEGMLPTDARVRHGSFLQLTSRNAAAKALNSTLFAGG